MEEDVTLPGTLSGCSGLPVLPGDLDGINAAIGLGNGVLPNVSEEKVSPTRARNMKDFENQITELKKENFNLKLRIYFLEERMQQEFDGPTEHVYKTNIELKVEVESLKRELHEREQLLVKASKAVESLAEGSGSEIQRVKEDARKKVKQVEDFLTKKIRLLEEDAKAAQAELEKAFAGTEMEKALRLSLENKLSVTRKMHEGDLAVALEEKDRLIEELKLSLKSKEALIQCLEEEKSQMASADNVSSRELQGLSAAQREEKERDEAAERECQKERTQFEERIQALQEDLREKEREIATEKKNSLKRDKAIQGLTMALKSKEKEVEELNSEIKDLSATFAKVREGPRKTQAPKFQGSEDHEVALMEKESLLAELHSENLTKSTENRRLFRNIKKVTQERNDLQQEKLRLERDLEKAHREGSRGARTIQDLRNEVERLRNEVERLRNEVKDTEKAVSESSKKLHAQEQVISRLRESASQKDLLLQKFNEKDFAAIQQNRYLMTSEDLKSGSEGLITEKCSSQQSPDSKFIFSEEKQASDCEGPTQFLKKEQSIYAHLVKSLQDPDSVEDLRVEIKDILSLRRQLEQDVLAYRNLQNALQEQLSQIQRREEESFSFYSDQTSYLSICLEEHSQLQVEHFSQEELKRKVSELIQLVKELYTDNHHLKKTIFDLSCMSFQGNCRLESTKQIELLASKDDEDTIKIEEDDKNNFQSDQDLEQSNEILEGYAKGACKNGYLGHTDSRILDHSVAHMPGCSGEQSSGELMGLLAAFFLKKATPSLESSRPDLLQALGELLLERICLADQRLAGDHLHSEAEKILNQLAVQLRGELKHSFPVESFSKSHDELKSISGSWPTKSGYDSKVDLKNASVQTVPIQDDSRRSSSEGKRVSWEEKQGDAIFGTKPELEDLCGLSGLQASPLPFSSAINKDEEVAQLQTQILEPQEELKEFKTCNKELHPKLIVAEAMMEGVPVPDPALPDDQPPVRAAYHDSPRKEEEPETTCSARRDKEVDSDQYTSFEIDSEICPPDDCAILPACKENPKDFLGSTSVATYLNSKSQLSVKVSMTGTDQSENVSVSDDTEFLKQKIHDLQAELEVCRNFIFQLQKYAQCSEAIITVLCGTEGAQDGLNKPKGSTEEEMTFPRLHQVRYVKHMKILHALTPDMIDSRKLESLRQQLVEQQCELQEEQNLNLELFGEIHNLQKMPRELSPMSYSSLVQSQARELSLQRQQIENSHGVYVLCRRHTSTMIRAFEELLQASDVDGCVAEGFREQLNQCAGLLEQLEKLFLHGKSAGVELSPQSELIERFRTEGDHSTYQHLPESPAPFASRALSDDEMSDKSFLSQEQKPDIEAEKASVVASHFPQDLLMEHIQEFRTLRKRLEESIKTNEKLQEQLDRQGFKSDQGPTNIPVYGSELHSSLTSEIHFLRNEIQALSMIIEKWSKDKQENEKLRESLSMKAASLEHLQQEYASVREENERLQREITHKERHKQQLSQEVCSSRQELSRVQEEVRSREQLISQNDKLRVELRVYEKLDAEHQKLQQEARSKASGEGWKGQDPSSDLHSLLTEIQALQDQLERNIQTNSTLRSKLEEPLLQGSKSPQEGTLSAPVHAQAVPEQSLPLDKHDGSNCPIASDRSFDLFESTEVVTPKSASETVQLTRQDDSLSCDSNRLVTSPLCMPRLVTGQHLWASNSGCHVLGLIEDYDVLCKQISQGQRLLAKMDIQTQEALSPSQGLGTKGLQFIPLGKFLPSMNTAKLFLEEASRLLKLFWRVSVPTDDQCLRHCEQIGEMKAEITKLHKKLFEQEKKLQNTAKLLQQSKHQEKVIFDQLAITHQVLRKARENLELRPGAVHPGTSSPSRPGS